MINRIQIIVSTQTTIIIYTINQVIIFRMLLGRREEDEHIQHSLD